MWTLEKVILVQFFLYEQQVVSLAEITGIFGPNGSGKSSLLDAVQIAMCGANSRSIALNAQADEQNAKRSIRAYCLGQCGETAEDRARDNATTYITLIWRNTQTGAPLTLGVCLYASVDRDGHEVLGRYVLPGIELALTDHTELVDNEARPRAWPTFRHQLLERNRVNGRDAESPLYPDSERYLQAVLVGLRGSGSVARPDAFVRAFRFALRMRFDKSVDQIVRNDVLEAKPTNIKQFKAVTDSFRQLAETVKRVEAKIADGKGVAHDLDRAAHESCRANTWNALLKSAVAEKAGEAHEEARSAKHKASDALDTALEEHTRHSCAEADASALADRARSQREAHSAHKDYGALQHAIQVAQARTQSIRSDIGQSMLGLARVLTEASRSEWLTVQAPSLAGAAEDLRSTWERFTTSSTIDQAQTLIVLRPALKQAQQAVSSLFASGAAIDRDLEEARQCVKDAQESLTRVDSGRQRLSTEVQRLLTELADHGVEATAVCDLVRISDSDWQPAIEAYLKRNMEALLVPVAHERDAFRIYRGMSGRNAVYGAKIAMESRQPVGIRPDPGTVAELVDGSNPAAVAYLRRQFGELRRASSDTEALAGQRTLTRDGMLVSTGEIERLRLVDARDFRIGRGSTIHRSAIQQELDKASADVRRHEADHRRLNTLLKSVQPFAFEDSVTKQVIASWRTMDDAQHEVASKSEQLNGQADAEYVRLGQEETAAKAAALEASQQVQAILVEIGRIKEAQRMCDEREVETRAAMEAAKAGETEAMQHPEVDAEYLAREWDRLIEKFGTQYGLFIQHAKDQRSSCEQESGRAGQRGLSKLAKFLIDHGEQAGSDVSTDWRRAGEWMSGLLDRLNGTELVAYQQQMDEAYRTSQETFRNDVAIALNNNLEWLGETMDRLNTVLRECPTFSNGERYRFRRTIRPQLEPLLRFVKNVATFGAVDDLLGGAGEMPEEFRTLLEDKVTPGASGVRSPLDDYREFFEFDIEILREDPVSKGTKVIGHLSKRIGPGSGGEHRAPLYVIAGAALASAYRLERGRKDGVRLMLLDEAFNKMDPTNIIATMRYLDELGLQVFMASPGENLGILTAFLHRYYDVLRDVDNNTVMIEARDVSPETRSLFRSDLPEFNPELVDIEISTMHGQSSIAPATSEVA